jgi:hypothetical protein
MTLMRRCTLLWPGLPWLWLRGSRAGLVLAIAFAVLLDAAIVSTWIWTELVDVQTAFGLWASVGATWVIAVASAVSAFPPTLILTQDAATEQMFVEARDAYLARDWLAAETKLLALLALRPTDGEAQLLRASLLRRVGRATEAEKALTALARSDSGLRWQSAIARERKLLERGSVAEPAEPPSAPSTPMRAAA